MESVAMWRSLLTLIVASGVIMGSPGPSTMSVTAVGAAFGVRRSLMYTGGLIVGTTAVLFAVAVGVVSLLLSIPHGAPVLAAVSSVYMLYLAWKIATAPPLTNHDPGDYPSFSGGLLLAIANPKAYLAIAAVFAGSTVAPNDEALDTAIKLVSLVVMIVLIHVSWLLAGASLSQTLRGPATARIVNLALAVALIVVTLVTFVG
jgi:threonine/homoserine/homoserine lactone efflux protein